MPVKVLLLDNAKSKDMKINNRKQFTIKIIGTLSAAAIASLTYCNGAMAKEPSAPKITSYKITQDKAPFYDAVYIAAKKTYRAQNMVSQDGLHWKSDPVKKASNEVLPKNFRRSPVSFLYDPSNQRYLEILNALDDETIDRGVHEPPKAQNGYYLRYKVSTDLGKSWLFDKRIIQEGKYTSENPLPEVIIGRNAFYMGDRGCKPIITQKGTILLPTQATLLGPGTTLRNPGDGWTYTDVRVIRGKWQKDGSISWVDSARVEADPKQTTRGVIEPTLAQLKDGRILMVMRGSNELKSSLSNKSTKEYSLSGYRWYCYSGDDGKTWSKPEPWKYDDSTPFFSPSSMSVLIQHSSGRVFWVGNITPTNPRGNLPRYPLVFGEVSQKNMMLIHDSVITVDTKKECDADKGRIDISHISVIEDPISHEIILSYPRNYNAYKNREWVTVRIGV
jgi:hypothetical protein